MKSGARWFALTLVTLWMSACSPYYTSEPFDARVVDADTGRPIDGALVLAWWQLYKPSLDSGRTGSVLEVLETVTDQDGRFHINGFTKLNPRFESLDRKDPGVIVYVRGYLPEMAQSEYTPEELKELGAKRKSTLAGKTLRLKRWDGNNEKLAGYLSSINADLGPLVKSCLWTAAPRFIGALDAEAKRIRREQPSIRFSPLTARNLEKDCGVDPKSLDTADK